MVVSSEMVWPYRRRPPLGPGCPSRDAPAAAPAAVGEPPGPAFIVRARRGDSSADGGSPACCCCCWQSAPACRATGEPPVAAVGPGFQLGLPRCCWRSCLVGRSAGLLGLLLSGEGGGDPTASRCAMAAVGEACCPGAPPRLPTGLPFTTALRYGASAAAAAVGLLWDAAAAGPARGCCCKPPDGPEAVAWLPLRARPGGGCSRAACPPTAATAAGSCRRLAGLRPACSCPICSALIADTAAAATAAVALPPGAAVALPPAACGGAWPGPGPALTLMVRAWRSIGFRLSSAGRSRSDSSPRCTCSVRCCCCCCCCRRGAASEPPPPRPPRGVKPSPPATLTLSRSSPATEARRPAASRSMAAGARRCCCPRPPPLPIRLAAPAAPAPAACMEAVGRSMADSEAASAAGGGVRRWWAAAWPRLDLQGGGACADPPCPCCSTWAVGRWAGMCCSSPSR